MSKGIGKTQQRILDIVDNAEFPFTTVAELAEAIGCSDRQIRRAVRSLESRGLLVLRERVHLGWTGYGEYGALRRKWLSLHDAPTVLSVKAGEDWPEELSGGKQLVATVDSEFYRQGIPTHGLLVSTPRRIILAYKARRDHFDRELSDKERAELRQKVDGCQLSPSDRRMLNRLTR
jgi:hypothetical protein